MQGDCFSAWLKGDLDPVVDRVNRRIEDFTNLNQATSEELQVHTQLSPNLLDCFFQVANYGLGGHYDPHFDFARVILTFVFFFFFRLPITVSVVTTTLTMTCRWSVHPSRRRVIS